MTTFSAAAATFAPQKWMPRMKALVTWSTLVIGLIALGACATDPPRANPPGDGYRLVWTDEFNEDGPPNPKDWGYENGFVRNRELQWYQPDNATCRDGRLVIEARKERKPNPKFDPKRENPTTSKSERAWRNRETIDITSASVNTRGKREWTFGRFEVRAKIDVRPGSWPAFWTLGVAGPWAFNGEIDVMEYYKDTLLFNVAWAGTPNDGWTTWNTKRVPLDSLPKGWADGFHTWRMDWTPESIELYLDDVLMNSQDLTRTVNRDPLPDGAPRNPFHAPIYLLLNQAVGGMHGGDPAGTEFPIRYEVDYVRVYQLP